MSVIESPLDASAQRAYEITSDLRRLQEWSAPDACAQVAGELDRIRRELMAEGVRERSASRIASALGRYAFLTQEGCSPLPWALWRMYTVDGIPADVLAGRPFQKKKLCRTFSDCTTAPRHGLVSGCYPLDPHYKSLPEAADVQAAKQRPTA